MRQRIGRPGLLGTMARTAVISGTATAVSGGVQRRQAERAAGRQAAAEVQQPQYVEPAPVPQAAPAAPGQDRIAQLSALADLKAQGVLTEAEFEAEKARILAGG